MDKRNTFANLGGGLKHLFFVPHGVELSIFFKCVLGGSSQLVVDIIGPALVSDQYVVDRFDGKSTEQFLFDAGKLQQWQHVGDLVLPHLIEYLAEAGVLAEGPKPEILGGQNGVGWLKLTTHTCRAKSFVEQPSWDQIAMAVIGG